MGLVGWGRDFEGLDCCCPFVGVSDARRSLHVVFVRVALIFGFTWTGVSVVPSLTQVACRLTFMVICVQL